MKTSWIPALVLLGAGAFICAAIFAQAPKGDEPANPTVQLLRTPDGGTVEWVQGGLNFRDQSHQLAKKYVTSQKEDDKKEIRKQLAEVLAKQFEAQVKQQEKELADLEKQIASLKATLKKRQDNKTAIIDRRIEQLIQDAEGLGWTAPSAPNTGNEFIRSVRPSP
jgi:flagellar motility protein MotE (MotC chaperone)